MRTTLAILELSQGYEMGDGHRDRKILQGFPGYSTVLFFVSFSIFLSLSLFFPFLSQQADREFVHGRVHLSARDLQFNATASSRTASSSPTRTPL